MSEFIGAIEFVSVTSFDNYRVCDSVPVIFFEYNTYIYVCIYNIFYAITLNRRAHRGDYFSGAKDRIISFFIHF